MQVPRDGTNDYDSRSISYETYMEMSTGTSHGKVKNRSKHHAPTSSSCQTDKMLKQCHEAERIYNKIKDYSLINGLEMLDGSEGAMALLNAFLS